MAVNTLFNVQIDPEKRVPPSKMWPDWGKSEIEEDEPDPLKLEKNKTALQASIQFLENM